MQKLRTKISPLIMNYFLRQPKSLRNGKLFGIELKKLKNIKNRSAYLFIKEF